MLHSDSGLLPCEVNPVETWFSSVPADIAMAKALCSTCPRRGLCLTETLATEDMLGHQLVGVHGGLEPHERINLKP